MKVGLFRSKPVDELIENSSFGFDFPSLIANLKSEGNWIKGELASKILLISPGKSIILTAFHKGSEIKSSQIDESISIQLIEGKLKFKARKVLINLIKGQSLTLYEKTNYSLTALEDTVFTLTVENSPVHAVVN